MYVSSNGTAAAGQGAARPANAPHAGDEDLSLALRAAGMAVEEVERYLAAGTIVPRDEQDRRASALRTCAR